MQQKLAIGGRVQLNRFCRQYLQLQLELDYPDEEYLRKDAFQEAIYSTMFDESVIERPPPARYQLKVLKKLIKKIEQSIQDWEEDVCYCFPVSNFIYIQPGSFQYISSHLISSSDRLSYLREYLIIS